MRRKGDLRIILDTRARVLRRNDFRVFVDRYKFGLCATEAALVPSLYRQLGRTVHSDCTLWKGLHLLREYIAIKEKLRRSGAPYIDTNLGAFGYALCKIASRRATKRESN
jgi:hypothetical protein